MAEKPAYNPMEKPPKDERSEAAKEIPFAALNSGDKIDVQTQNSRYQFEIYLDPKSGKKGLRETSGTGRLAGTEGIPLFDNSIKVGKPVRYSESTGTLLWQTSNIVDFQITRNPNNAIRNAGELSSNDQAAVEQLRDLLGPK